MAENKNIDNRRQSTNRQPTSGGGTAIDQYIQQMLQSRLGGPEPTFDMQNFEFLTGLGVDPGSALMALFPGLRPQGGSGGGASGPSAAELAIMQGNLAVNQFSAEANAAYQRAQVALGQGNLELAFQELSNANYWNAQGQALGEGQLGVGAFNAQEGAVQGRGALDLGAADTMSSLVNTLGGLAESQARLGLDILSTPRNAIAGFFLGQGAENPGSAFSPSRLLGIDPAQIQSVIQDTLMAANSAMTRANQPNDIDLQSILTGLSQRANQALQGAPGIDTSSVPDPEAAFQRTPTQVPAPQPMGAPAGNPSAVTGNSPAPAMGPTGTGGQMPQEPDRPPSIFDALMGGGMMPEEPARGMPRPVAGPSWEEWFAPRGDMNYPQMQPFSPQNPSPNAAIRFNQNRQAMGQNVKDFFGQIFGYAGDRFMGR